MEEIKEVLKKHFNLGQKISLEKYEAGFLSSNYIVSDGGTKFFLKGYVKGVDRVLDIHKAKQHFSSHGIPVILPIKTISGETFFSVGQKVFALFPFVSSIHHNRQSIPDNIIIEIAHIIGEMHHISAQFPLPISTVFKRWNDAEALQRADELTVIINALPEKSEFDKLALKNIELKKILIVKYSIDPKAYDLEPYILLHGDFHEQNLFFDEKGKIKYVFDFGEVKIGPRGHELWRSADYMFLNGIFSDENIAKAILYLKTYNSINPISRNVLMAGFNTYFQMNIHSMWVETEYYVKKNTKVAQFLETRSTIYLSNHKDDFLKKILEGVYGK